MSVIAALAVALILSSTIFRVRNYNVVFSEQIEGVSENDIISASGVKNGRSIFLVNKNTATYNIEKNIPYAKVERIYTTFPNTVNYLISKRTEFCYFENNDSFIICDSSLKILRTSNQRPNLVKISTNINETSPGCWISISSLNDLFLTFKENISIEIDGIKSPDFSLTDEKAIESIDEIIFNSTNNIIKVKATEGFYVEYDLNEAVTEKHYYLMGILVNNSSSILTQLDRESGNTFVLEKTSNGMRKYIKSET